MQYCKVIERLSYDMIVHNKDMTNLIQAGFTRFIKDQLRTFKSTKAVIPLLQALGILATKQNIKDEQLNMLLNELQADSRLTEEIGFKFVLDWCLGNLNGAGSLEMNLTI